jgi:hypothetical protein
VRRAPSTERQGTGMLAFKCPPLPPLNAWTRNVVLVVIKSAFAVQDAAFRGWPQYHRPPAGPAPEIQAKNIRRLVESITRLILTNSERNAHVGHPGRIASSKTRRVIRGGNPCPRKGWPTARRPISVNRVTLALSQALPVCLQLPTYRRAPITGAMCQNATSLLKAGPFLLAPL